MAASAAASEAKISEQPPVNTCAILNSDFNCTNCDIKFDSESSLRVHLQVSPKIRTSEKKNPSTPNNYLFRDTPTLPHITLLANATALLFPTAAGYRL